MASANSSPNAFGSRVPVPTSLNIAAWESYLGDYVDKVVVDFLAFGWPINYSSLSSPQSSDTNHGSALQYPDHVYHYIKTELSFGALAGPFKHNPLHVDLTRSPLQTVPKRGSDKRRVIMDLSFPPGRSVNAGISSVEYLDVPFRLRLPGIDRLCDFVRAKGPGCLIFKTDLQRAYRQLPVDPKDYRYLGFQFDNNFYFDLRCPFGLRSSAMICQRTTKAVVYIYSAEGFSADVYLDDFFGAEVSCYASTAYDRLLHLLSELGLNTSVEKNVAPTTEMLCLGVQVNTKDMTLTVPNFRLVELSTELQNWLAMTSFTKRQLQSFLGKLSYVTACVKPGRIFMSRLLNTLRNMKSSSSALVSDDMRDDIRWWSQFLPLFNGVAIIKPSRWDFDDMYFTTDACISGGGATCLNECFARRFPDFVIALDLHISALELLVIVVAVRTWSSVLRGKRFIVSCDNESAVMAINSGRSRDVFMQRCLRRLWLDASVHDFEIRAEHIPGQHNVLADCLSRWHKAPRYQEQFITLQHSLHLSFKHTLVSDEFFRV